MRALRTSRETRVPMKNGFEGRSSRAAAGFALLWAVLLTKSYPEVTALMYMPVPPQSMGTAPRPRMSA